MTIELADKNPPLSDIHPMRALYLIPAADEKTLNVQQPKKWSKPLLDFIRYCLNKDPRKRPSADDCLRHPWITKGVEMELDHGFRAKSVVMGVMQEARAAKEAKRIGKTSSAAQGQQAQHQHHHQQKSKQHVQKEQMKVDVDDSDSEDDGDEPIVLVDDPPKKQPVPQQPPPPQPSAATKPAQDDRIVLPSPQFMAQHLPKPTIQIDPIQTGGTEGQGSASSLSSAPEKSPAPSTASAMSSGSALKAVFQNIFKKRTSGEYVGTSSSTGLGWTERVDLPRDASTDDLTECMDMTQPLLQLLKSSSLGGGIASLPSPMRAPLTVIPLDLRLKLEILCADILSCFAIRIDPSTGIKNRLECRFLLMGTDKGLLAADMTQHTHATAYTDTLDAQYPAHYFSGEAPMGRLRWIVRKTKFKQVQVLEDYGVVMCIAGRFHQIRSYRLASLKKLVRFSFGYEPLNRSFQPAGGVGVGGGGGDSVGGGHEEVDDQASNYDDEELMHDMDLVDVSDAEFHSPAFWVSDYEKLVNTRESQFFCVTRTQSTCYMSVLFKNDIVVYEWAKLPYLRFMKVKQFWLPETPKTFSLAHNGSVVKALCVVYERETNVIEFEDARVAEVEVHDDYQGGQPRDVLKDAKQMGWSAWTQLPREAQSQEEAVVASVQGGAGAKVQVPSWYATIKTMQPAKSAVTIPSAAASSSASTKPSVQQTLRMCYLATFGAMSKVINLEGRAVQPELYSLVNRVEWGVPSQVSGEFEQSAPRRVVIVHPGYAMALHKNYLEVAPLHPHGSGGANNGSSHNGMSQVIKTRHSTRMLVPTPGSDLCERRRGLTIVASWDKKRKVTQLFWLRESEFDLGGVMRAQRVVDRAERPVRVIGTGAIVKA